MKKTPSDNLVKAKRLRGYTVKEVESEAKERARLKKNKVDEKKVLDESENWE